MSVCFRRAITVDELADEPLPFGSMRTYVANAVEFDGERAAVRAQDAGVRNKLLGALFLAIALLRLALRGDPNIAMMLMGFGLTVAVAVWIGGTPTRVIEFDAGRGTLGVDHRGMLAETEDFELARTDVDACFVRKIDEWSWGWFLKSTRREMLLCVVTDEYDANKLGSLLRGVYGDPPTEPRAVAPRNS